MRLSIVITLAMIIAMTGCSRAPTVTITNKSTNALANVVVSGTGFSERIDNIAAGADQTITVHPRGESGIRVVFDTGGRHVDSGEQGYFEGGGDYRVAVIVQPDLKVSVSSDLRSY
jgi:uncharacterized lipoprotein YajG